MRGSGGDGCRKALLPGEEDTEKVLEGDVVMKGKKKTWVGCWREGGGVEKVRPTVCRE